MGAWIDTHVIDSRSRKEIEAKIADLREHDLYENGHDGYSGSWGQTYGKPRYLSTVFESQRAAEEYLQRHCEKRGPILAVEFYLPAEPTKREKAKRAKLAEKVQQANQKHTETCRKIAAAFWGRKSKMVGCSGCGSKLSREHLAKRYNPYERPQCPVCSTSLLSETDEKRIQASKDRVTKAVEARSATSAPKPSKQIATMIGYCAAS